MAKVKYLRGDELAEFIKERQARQVRALRQAKKIYPKLAVVMSEHAEKSSEVYVRLKRAYGNDILIETEVHVCLEAEMAAKITKLNNDPQVHGIILQLPLAEKARTDEIIEKISPEKDVDGLRKSSPYLSATAEAINWLLPGYNIDLKTSQIVIIGQGKLVGAPLTKTWRDAGYSVSTIDVATPPSQRQKSLAKAQIIITAAGAPGSLMQQDIPAGAAVIDAGTALENASRKLHGDVADEVYDEEFLAQQKIAITPVKGGVGPLTIAALYDHVISAAERL